MLSKTRMRPSGSQRASCCFANGPVSDHFTRSVVGSITATVLMLRRETRMSPAANCGNFAAMEGGSGSALLRWRGSFDATSTFSS